MLYLLSYVVGLKFEFAKVQLFSISTKKKSVYKFNISHNIPMYNAL